MFTCRFVWGVWVRPLVWLFSCFRLFVVFSGGVGGNFALFRLIAYVALCFVV